MGKGDGRRPTMIADTTFANNWCATWGHKMRRSSDICINCGKSAVEIEREHSRLVPARPRRAKRNT